MLIGNIVSMDSLTRLFEVTTGIGTADDSGSFTGVPAGPIVGEPVISEDEGTGLMEAETQEMVSYKISWQTTQMYMYMYMYFRWNMRMYLKRQ